jgi:hypothetical protein
MRELTKSFIRLTWVMSVFGLQQVTTVLSDLRTDDGDREGAAREGGDARVAAAFDAVSADTQKHLQKRTRSMAEAGDKLQSELVDLIFDTVRPDEWGLRRLVERGARFADHSAKSLRSWAD